MKSHHRPSLSILFVFTIARMNVIVVVNHVCKHVIDEIKNVNDRIPRLMKRREVLCMVLFLLSLLLNS